MKKTTYMQDIYRMGEYNGPLINLHPFTFQNQRAATLLKTMYLLHLSQDNKCLLFYDRVLLDKLQGSIAAAKLKLMPHGMDGISLFMAY